MIDEVSVCCGVSYVRHVCLLSMIRGSRQVSISRWDMLCYYVGLGSYQQSLGVRGGWYIPLALRGKTAHGGGHAQPEIG